MVRICTLCSILHQERNWNTFYPLLYNSNGIKMHIVYTKTFTMCTLRPLCAFYDLKKHNKNHFSSILPIETARICTSWTPIPNFTSKIFGSSLVLALIELVMAFISTKHFSWTVAPFMRQCKMTCGKNCIIILGYCFIAGRQPFKTPWLWFGRLEIKLHVQLQKK